MLVDQYRLVVTGVGIVYDGNSPWEAMRQFRVFLNQSTGNAIALFKNLEMAAEFRLPDRESPYTNT